MISFYMLKWKKNTFKLSSYLDKCTSVFFTNWVIWNKVFCSRNTWVIVTLWEVHHLVMCLSSRFVFKVKGWRSKFLCTVRYIVLFLTLQFLWPTPFRTIRHIPITYFLLKNSFNVLSNKKNHQAQLINSSWIHYGRIFCNTGCSFLEPLIYFTI